MKTLNRKIYTVFKILFIKKDLIISVCINFQNEMDDKSSSISAQNKPHFRSVCCLLSLKEDFSRRINIALLAHAIRCLSAVFMIVSSKTGQSLLGLASDVYCDFL